MEAFQPFIKAVGRGEKLKRDLLHEEAYAALEQILTGTATEAQIGAFLITQRVKGEAVAEIRGFIDCVRDRFTTFIRPQVQGLLDLVTPFDGKVKTAQLAPAVAFVLVAAGIPVLLPGAQDVPTKRGVTVGAVLEALGVPAFLPPPLVTAQIETVGIGHYDASQFAPRWDALIPIRHQFGLRTVCNTVEKLFNVADAPYQISGFFHGNYIRRIRETQTGRVTSYIIQGEEGSLEVAAGRRTPIFGMEAAADVEIDTAKLGFNRRVRIELPPELDAHVELNAHVLAGEASAAADQVALTAGTILFLLGAESSVAAGFECAQKLIATKEAKRSLKKAMEWRST